MKPDRVRGVIFAMVIVSFLVHIGVPLQPSDKGELAWAKRLQWEEDEGLNHPALPFAVRRGDGVRADENGWFSGNLLLFWGGKSFVGTKKLLPSQGFWDESRIASWCHPNSGHEPVDKGFPSGMISG